MKRIVTLILITLLLLVPVFFAQADADGRVFTDEDVLSDEEIRTINARADELYAAHGIAPYFFFYSNESDLIPFAGQFADAHVPEANAIVLGLNSEYYYFLKKGAAAEAAFPDDVCEETLWTAFQNVQNDPEGKILAYLDAVDGVLNDVAANPTDPTVAPTQAPDEDPLAVPAYIALTDGGKPTLVDRERLLTDSQAETLSERLKEIGTAYRCDVIIATVSSLGSKTAEEYADDFFDYNGYGYGATADASGTTVNGDGILLLLSMEDRDFAISTSGYAITAFTDFGIQTYLEDRFLPYLRENDYNGGFTAFADGCEDLLKMAREDIPYDCYHVYADENAMQASVKAELNQKAEQLMLDHGVGVYFVETADASDPGAYLNRFIPDHVYESDAVLFCMTPYGYMVSTEGSVAQQKFTNKELKKLDDAIRPYYGKGDVNGTARAYMDYAEKVLNKRPLNVFALILSFLGGGLFGLIPVSSMKHQLKGGVSRNTTADRYLEPNSFVMTQSSDVLLGKNTSRSVHVVHTDSSSGGGRSGGGGFHGGSSTHTSSSGGTHGGHSGKF